MFARNKSRSSGVCCCEFLCYGTDVSEVHAASIFNVKLLAMDLHLVPFLPITTRFTLKMEPAWISETMVSCHNTHGVRSQKNSNIHRRENLKFRFPKKFFF